MKSGVLIIGTLLGLVVGCAVAFALVTANIVNALSGKVAGERQSYRARAHDQDIGTRHGLTAPVVRNGGFQPPASPPKRRARALFLRPQKLRANRSSAILELIYFGPISEVTARISISCHYADRTSRVA